MLTDNQLSFFSQNGYLVLSNALSATLLQQLRQCFEEAMVPDALGVERTVNKVKGQCYITNVEHPCSLGNLAGLELMGLPLVLEAAEAICGPDFFPIQDFAVIKMLGDDTPVLWHQDMVHGGGGRCCTMGIYLDDANENDGALRIVPASHRSGLDICELGRQPAVEMPMKAGDILVHDMMLAHSSEPLRQNQLRRVIYFEFLSAAHVRQEAIYPEATVQRGYRLLQTAKDYCALLPQPSEEALQTVRQTLGEIYSQPVNARPSTYCFEQHRYRPFV
jgi:ectoine hydroxylase-related dioxygenase (phytanoyl-CoA dioxygenase family)